MKSWLMDELQTTDLRDKRAERRLLKLFETLSQSSPLSVPATFDDRTEIVAAYQLFDNEKVDFESNPNCNISYKHFCSAAKKSLLRVDNARVH